MRKRNLFEPCLQPISAPPSGSSNVCETIMLVRSERSACVCSNPPRPRFSGLASLRFPTIHLTHSYLPHFGLQLPRIPDALWIPHCYPRVGGWKYIPTYGLCHATLAIQLVLTNHSNSQKTVFPRVIQHSSIHQLRRPLFQTLHETLPTHWCCYC